MLGVVSTLAGSGVSGYADGLYSVAEFFNPQGVSVDSTGNVWVADQVNHMIRKIDTAGWWLQMNDSFFYMKTNSFIFAKRLLVI